MPDLTDETVKGLTDALRANTEAVNAMREEAARRVPTQADQSAAPQQAPDYSSDILTISRDVEIIRDLAYTMATNIGTIVSQNDLNGAIR